MKASEGKGRGKKKRDKELRRNGREMYREEVAIRSLELRHGLLQCCVGSNRTKGMHERRMHANCAHAKPHINCCASAGVNVCFCLFVRREVVSSTFFSLFGRV